MSGRITRLNVQQGETAIMGTLNKDAAEVLRARTPNAVTAVTGSGLFRPAPEVADRSGHRDGGPPGTSTALPRGRWLAGCFV